jgi:hypothetical protein
MDDFIKDAIKLVESDKGTDIDKCFEIEFKKSGLVQNDDLVLNFTTLDFERLSKLFEANEKLLKDFFKFSLYQTLLEETRYRIFETFKVDYKYLQNVILYCFDQEDIDLLITVIDRNNDSLLEPELVVLFSNILNSNLESFKYSGNSKHAREVLLGKLFSIDM